MAILWPLLEAENFDREDACGGASRNYGRGDTDRESGCRDPYSIAGVRLEWNIGNCIHLGIEWNQPPSISDPRKGKTHQKSRDSSGHAHNQPLQDENVSNLAAPRPHGHQHG